MTITSDRPSDALLPKSCAGCAPHFLLLAAVSGFASLGVCGTATQEGVESIVDSLVTLRALEQKVAQGQQPSREQRTQVARTVSTLVANAAPQLARCIMFYQARALYLANDREAAAKVVQRGLQLGVDIPDMLRLSVWLEGEGDRGEPVQARLQLWHRLAEVLPVSWYGRDSDSRKGRPVPKIDPPPPMIPITRVRTMFEIAELHDRMGSWVEASDARLEALYAGHGDLNPIDIGKQWLRVAQTERQWGDPALALRAYLRAAYSDASLRETAIEGVQACLWAKVEDRSAPPTRTWDTATVRRIADLYAELNLHPLALALLDEAAKHVPDDLAEQRRAISEAWLNIVRQLRELKGPDCHILGQRAADVRDWARVPIARPSDTFWVRAQRK